MKNKKLLLITVVIVAMCIFVVAVIGIKKKSNIKNEDTSATIQESAEKADDTVVLAEGESLIIPVDDITTDVSFIPVEVDGTRMEIIAVRDNDGNIRTAFNTCQICFGSGKGYYVQKGNDLVCQNCGNRFTVNQIEVESGGCNPWPIFENDKIITDDSIEITYDFLTASKNVFANWKVSY